MWYIGKDTSSLRKAQRLLQTAAIGGDFLDGAAEIEGD